jgi:hypothetical protein
VALQPHMGRFVSSLSGLIGRFTHQAVLNLQERTETLLVKRQLRTSARPQPAEKP